MITFSQLGKFGRLGNQLFQYAVLRSVALETGYIPKIPDPETTEWQNQPCQLDKFNIECDFLEREDYYKIQHRFLELEGNSKYLPQVFDVRENTDLHGYFQNYQYFSKHEKQIRQEFLMNKELEEKGKDYVNNLKKNNEKIVSVHIRRGDLTDGTYSEYTNYYGKGDVLTKDSIFGRYFFEALNVFENQNVKFLVFSGGSQGGMKQNQSDIGWCKENLKGDEYLFCEGNSDVEDFVTMKHCDHHITFQMSSFGWWAAFLNDKQNKIVVMHKKDGNEIQYGFRANNWIQIKEKK